MNRRNFVQAALAVFGAGAATKVLGATPPMLEETTSTLPLLTGEVKGIQQIEMPTAVFEDQIVEKGKHVCLCSQMLTAENRVDGMAGEHIEAGDVVTIRADGKFYKATYHVDRWEDDYVIGFSGTNTAEGRPMTAFRNVRFSYSESLVPGEKVYIAADKPGALSRVPERGQEYVGVGFTNGRLICTG